MALEHHCDCGNIQDARISTKGVILDDNKLIISADDVCRDCDKVADVAKKEALEKRKKKI